MQVILTPIADTMTPHLRKLYKAAGDKLGIHEAIGLGLQDLAARAFNDGSLRPRPWPPKKDGTAATLKKSGTLWQSIRSTASATSVTIGSDRVYAAIHQLGGTTPAHVIRPKNKKALAWPGGPGPRGKVNHPGSKIPARPYLPFDQDGAPTRLALDMIDDVVDAKLGRPS